MRSRATCVLFAGLAFLIACRGESARVEATGKLDDWLSSGAVSARITKPDQDGRMTLALRNDGQEPINFSFRLEGWFGGAQRWAFDGQEMHMTRDEGLPPGTHIEVSIYEVLFQEPRPGPLERLRVTVREAGGEHVFVFER